MRTLGRRVRLQDAIRRQNLFSVIGPAARKPEGDARVVPSSGSTNMSEHGSMVSTFCAPRATDLRAPLALPAIERREIHAEQLRSLRLVARRSLEDARDVTLNQVLE